MKFKFPLLLPLFLLLAIPLVGQKKYERKANKLIKKMTLQEKLGQLNLPSSGDITTGSAKSSNIAQKIRDGKIGGLFNIKTAKRINDVQKIAMEESRLKIPLIFAMDVIHGYKSTFPIPLGLSASWDLDMIRKTARIAANEATADGISWTFSPMTDISRDPRWGRVSEGAGEDAFLGSQIAKAMVEGYQGDDLAKNNTMLACVKHFALYGAPEAGRDYNTVDMSRVRMYNEYFPPYKAAVDAGVETVMTAFNDVDGVPASGNKWLMTNVLRNQWEFDGFVVTDYTAINEMMSHGMGDLQDVSALALNAGVEMDMVGEGFLTTLEKSLNEGRVSIEKIDAAVRKILIAKMKLGLFEDPYRYSNEQRAKTEVYTTKNRDFARKVATESMVLLKNDKQTLPLKKSGTIALVGPLANTPKNMAGTWSVATDQDKSIGMLEGMNTLLGDKANVLHAKGSNVSYDLDFEKRVTMFGKEIPRDNRTDQELRDEAVTIAKKADVIVAAIGETAEMSGESSSRTNLKIPQAQQDLLKALVETGKPVVIVLFTGRPLAINQEKEMATAILNVWFPGSEAGLAITDVLFGDVNPSGKLTMTFPRNVGQVPIYYNAKNTGRPLDTKKVENCNFQKFKSNYLDVCNTPLYPFGYGLSYTSFEYGKTSVSSEKLPMNGKITISATVKNTGNYDGKEVVQLYVRDKVGTITLPMKELKGFKKIFLKKGEQKTVRFDLTAEDLKYYNSNIEYGVEPGLFEVKIAPSSDFTFKQTFELVK